MEIKYSCPEKIYKYLDYEGIEKTLTSQSLKLSRAIDFNDPLDMYLQNIYGFKEKNLSRFFLEEFYKIISKDIVSNQIKNKTIKPFVILMNTALSNATEAQKIIFKDEFLKTNFDSLLDINKKKENDIFEINKFFKNEGIFCSTVDFNNLLMWAHYADKHRGAVIELKPNKKEDSFLLMSKKVNYTNQRPIMYKSIEELKKCIFFSSEEEIKAKTNNFVNDFIYSKSKEWSYEKEYRLTIPDRIPENKPFETLPFHSKELTSIYLGCRMSDDNKNNITKLAKKINPSISIYNACISNSKYQLDFKKL